MGSDPFSSILGLEAGASSRVTNGLGASDAVVGLVDGALGDRSTWLPVLLWLKGCWGLPPNPLAFASPLAGVNGDAKARGFGGRGGSCWLDGGDLGWADDGLGGRARFGRGCDC